jgi:hypothetical protein
LKTTLALMTALAVVGCAQPSQGAPDSRTAGAAVVASVSGPGGGPRTIVDGDLSTGWAGPEAPYWFEIDLGEQLEIETVRALVGRGFLGRVAINVGVHEDPGRQPATFQDGFAAGGWLETRVGYEARFIRISVEEADGLTIWMEVEVLLG